MVQVNDVDVCLQPCLVSSAHRKAVAVAMIASAFDKSLAAAELHLVVRSRVASAVGASLLPTCRQKASPANINCQLFHRSQGKSYEAGSISLLPQGIGVRP